MKKLIIWFGFSAMAFLLVTIILVCIIIIWEINVGSPIDYLTRCTFLTSIVLGCVWCMLLTYREIMEDNKK